MKPKAILKIVVDLAMTVLLFCLMAYLLVGETAHEWLGTAMFCLFIFHHILNWNWHRNLAKGRYSPLRVLAALLAVFGVYAFIKNDIASYMLLRTHFVFFDMEQPLILFFLEYLGMMGLWAAAAYYIGKLLVRCGKRREKKQ